MKKLDFVILALVAALSLAPLAFLARTRAAAVTVTQHGSVIYEGPLSQDRIVTAEGCLVEIANGRAYVREADCPDGLCLRSGAATPVHPVVCLPNELVITVSSPAETEAIDGVVY